MQKITPFFWFDGKAEEAATFYTSLFDDSAVVQVRRGQRDSVMSVTFRLAGQDYIALNGGPHFTFSPALSLFINCDTQAEVDRLWDALSAGGKQNRCGWLEDRFGVTWQVVPTRLGELLAGSDPAKSARAFQAMMGMTRLDIAALEAAYDG